jgi:hypothetical protein
MPCVIAIDSSTTATEAVVWDRDRLAALRCADDGEH